MDLFTPELEARIRRNIVGNMRRQRYDLAAGHMGKAIKDLHASIPERKRTSYGIFYVVKTLGDKLHQRLSEAGLDVLDAAGRVFDDLEDTAQFGNVRGAALMALSVYGVQDENDHRKVLPYFRRAARSEYWDLREFAAGFFPKLIKKYPVEMKRFLARQAVSKDPNARRFVSETLRPVRENRWFYREPDYPLSILRKMFKESAAYPRTSVGNNLSDLARRLPELVYGLVRELAGSGDRNSYWIAYRACRNLVKKDPDRVMDLLGVDEYKYKKRIHRRTS
jgi:3-methyladenine DNA glycosylase AlkC